MEIPFLDLVTPHLQLEEELTAVFRQALHTGGFIGGRVVEEFETAFASFCLSGYAIGAASGTDALRFAILASGVKPGDVVVTVPHSFIATTEAITQAGASPEFVDIDDRTYNMDPEKLRDYLETACRRKASGRLLSKRSGRPVTAIVPVHLYGQTADMDPILAVAEQHCLTVIEDACQAHGAEYFSKKHNQWRKAGAMGRAAAFSFYPGKNLGACGEAGAVTTNDAALASRLKMLRDHGQARKYYHEIEGYNGRLDAIQAGLLHAKLRYLERWNTARRECAARYRRLLSAADCGIDAAYEPSWSKPVYHLYVVRTRERDEMIGHLRRAGIGTGVHYPIPLHLQKAYEGLHYRKGDFPVTEAACAEILSLPMFPQLTAEQQVRIVEEISKVAGRSIPSKPASEMVELG
ncbi:MAG: DegT/DnrJ/EryC1/StrS family aminotransferase [Acidobacteria bacterium]|nr:DegT/DnrJ/EryC1/StrS family aminotransferase [Acidobacteriota bacterium]